VEAFIQEWGYIALFLYSFGGGMLGIAVAAFFAFNGDLNIYYVILVAFMSNFLGDQFLFTIARNNKSYAKDMMKKHQRKIALSYLMIRKYGSLVIFIQKYLYGIKTLIPLAMGLSKYQKNKFIVFNIIASIIWAIVVGYTAYSLGNVFINILEEYKVYGIVILVLIVFLVFRFIRKY
jgi:membrane protein DedA with SNARE-associated domain